MSEVSFTNCIVTDGHRHHYVTYCSVKLWVSILASTMLILKVYTLSL